MDLFVGNNRGWFVELVVGVQIKNECFLAESISLKTTRTFMASGIATQW